LEASLFFNRQVLRVFDRGFDYSEFFLGNYDWFSPGRAKKHDCVFDALFREAEARLGHLAKYSDVSSRVAI
jgi:hypothetical protein